MSEMPEWLVKKRNEYVDGVIDESRSTLYSEAEAIGIQKGFQKCFELMSDRQKLKPIESATEGEFVNTYVTENGEITACSGHVIGVQSPIWTHWTELPDTEGL